MAGDWISDGADYIVGTVDVTGTITNLGANFLEFGRNGAVPSDVTVSGLVELANTMFIANQTTVTNEGTIRYVGSATSSITGSGTPPYVLVNNSLIENTGTGAFSISTAISRTNSGTITNVTNSCTIP